MGRRPFLAKICCCCWRRLLLLLALGPLARTASYCQQWNFDRQRIWSFKKSLLIYRCIWEIVSPARGGATRRSRRWGKGWRRGSDRGSCGRRGQQAPASATLSASLSAAVFLLLTIIEAIARLTSLTHTQTGTHTLAHTHTERQLCLVMGLLLVCGVECHYCFAKCQLKSNCS